MPRAQKHFLLPTDTNAGVQQRPTTQAWHQDTERTSIATQVVTEKAAATWFLKNLWGLSAANSSKRIAIYLVRSEGEVELDAQRRQQNQPFQIGHALCQGSRQQHTTTPNVQRALSTLVTAEYRSALLYLCPKVLEPHAPVPSVQVTSSQTDLAIPESFLDFFSQVHLPSRVKSVMTRRKNRKGWSPLRQLQIKERND